MKGLLWIEATSADGEESSARWGNLTDDQIDAVLAKVEEILGRPDTVA